MPAMQTHDETDETPRGWTGHRRAALGASPFGSTFPGVLAASGFGVATLVWLAAGDRLPGGRWLAVHLFTLGVLTILIWTFSQHFAARFTGTRALAPRSATTRILTVLLVVSILTMLAGRAFDAHLPLVLGSLGIMVIVGSNLLVLGRLRRHATATRFVWIVRQYEHAHIAFLVAAGLGGALGAGWIPAPIFVAVRGAHIHLNVLGWAGLTVLATLVAFGPALLRVRIEPAADRRAATGLQAASFGLPVAAAGFVVTSIGGGAGPILMLTVGGLLAYGYGVLVVALPLLRATRRSSRSPMRWAVAASLSWFLIAIATDIVMMVTGSSGWSYSLAVMLLVGVLTQLVLAVLAYVGPMLRGRDFGSRDRLLARVERFARTRTAVFNLGVVLLLGAQGAGGLGEPAAAWGSRGGWFLVGAVSIGHLVGLLWPVSATDPDKVYSETAARYRTPPT
jgi:hypothetical protein